MNTFIIYISVHKYVEHIRHLHAMYIFKVYISMYIYLEYIQHIHRMHSAYILNIRPGYILNAYVVKAISMPTEFSFLSSRY